MENDMTPATGATPTILAKAASDRLANSVDQAVLRQRESDFLASIAAAIGGMLGLACLGMLGLYLLGGQW